MFHEEGEMRFVGGAVGTKSCRRAPCSNEEEKITCMLQQSKAYSEALGSVPGNGDGGF